ncbi:hypothetical protein ACLB1G_08880 [Oxalobacteraceae bacterium A2-2]
MQDRDSVAVIAIHGVADQKAGDTVSAVAALLSTAGTQASRYSDGVRDSVLLPVPPLAPLALAQVAGDVRARHLALSGLSGAGDGAAPPPTAPPSVAKALQQSLASDFKRPGWQAPADRTTRFPAAASAKAAPGDESPGAGEPAAGLPAAALTPPAIVPPAIVAPAVAPKAAGARTGGSPAAAPPAAVPPAAVPPGAVPPAGASPAAVPPGAAARAVVKPGGAHDAAGQAGSASGAGTGAPPGADLGLAYTDYLLFKAHGNGAGNEVYEASRIRMRRAQNGEAPARQVDLYEMYWADLSRLSGKIPQIVTEAFTLLFRFSQLGRDTVQRAAYALPGAPSRPWRRFAQAQLALDWGLAYLLSNICLHLLLVVLTIAVLGLVSRQAVVVHHVLAIALPLLGLWWLLYRYPLRAGGRLLALAAALAAAGLACRLPPHLLAGAAWLALLAVACDQGLRVAAERYPLARTVGRVFLAVLYPLLLLHVLAMMAHDGASMGYQYWLHASLRMLEYLLLLSILWWLAFAALAPCWLGLGAWLARGGGAARDVVGTGWLGVLVSLSAYTIVWMALWALLTGAAVEQAGGTPYTPLIFGRGADLAAGSFLDQRYYNSTMTFILVAALPTLLLLYIVATVLPSVLAELRLPVGPAAALGRWLSAGYRLLNAVIMALTVVGCGAAFVTATAMMLSLLGAEPLLARLAPVRDLIAGASSDTLRYFFVGAASVAAVFSLLGRALSRYAPWLRLPLDVALDVDNHFREFPRRAIPRARIFARYMALLEHVAAQGHGRIVIVAHSQGTVITTELLRYLQYRARYETDGRAALLWEQLEGRIELLTAGCPLRQLYAARFPELYGWVLDGAGPQAADIGVRRWVNAYTTGDYVGRWLWRTPASAYDEDFFTTAAPLARPETEFCLGAGAHTHYFKLPGQRMGLLIDALIQT